MGSAYDARARAEEQELANAAVDKGKALAQDGSAKVAEQSSKGREINISQHDVKGLPNSTNFASL